MDRSIAPPIHTLNTLKLPEFQKTTLAGEIPLGMIRQPGHPVITLNVVIPSGSLQEPLTGVTFFTAKMLSEGTASLNAYQIASKIDFYGGHLEINPSPDHVSIKLYSLKKFFPTLLTLLTDLLQNATNPEKEFDTLKQIRVQQIRQQMARNSVVAGLQFRKCLFGEAHPYGQIVEETHVNAITHDAVDRYYRKNFLRKPAIYLAGEVDETELYLVEKEFSQIEFKDRDNQPMPKPAISKNIHIEKPESVQTSIRMGNLTIDRKHPDHGHLKIANELLGGFFGSRLMMNIREKKGLTYGIYSSQIHFNELSFWQIGTDVLKEKKDEAIEEILKEIKNLQEIPPSADELLTLKNYMKGKIASSFDTILDTIDLAKTLDLNGMSLDYWSNLFTAIDQVTGEDINKAASKYFEPESIRVVTVG
ncbi:MAG: pitrilysin family protein [Cyclobacteriaceae bacterium]